MTREQAYEKILQNIRNGAYQQKCTEALVGVLMTTSEKMVERQYNRERDAAFRKDLIVVYGLENHPKAQRAVDIAWEHGHSSGLMEVLSYWDELADLLA